MAKTIEFATNAINQIKKRYNDDVIKNHHIMWLSSFKTATIVGFAVELHVNSKYDYDEALLNEWKKMLDADAWFIKVSRNKLLITFKVRYEKGD